MRSLLLPPLAIAALSLCAAAAHAQGSCSLNLEANDMMQFSTQKLTVAADCDEVELTLKHTGSANPAGMLHNWVLVRRADMSAVATAGLKAGREHEYRPAGDPRVLAATPLVGGGQSTSIRFDSRALNTGEVYAFFCSTPGHNVIMRGQLVREAGARVADASSR